MSVQSPERTVSRHDVSRASQSKRQWPPFCIHQSTFHPKSSILNSIPHPAWLSVARFCFWQPRWSLSFTHTHIIHIPRHIHRAGLLLLILTNNNNNNNQIISSYLLDLDGGCNRTPQPWSSEVVEVGTRTKSASSRWGDPTPKSKRRIIVIITERKSRSSRWGDPQPKSKRRIVWAYSKRLLHHHIL
jgi:hypothetical protein